MGLIHRLERRPDPKAVMEAWIDSPYAFILDGDGDFGRLSRYTFAGADPFLVLKTYGDSVEIRHPDGSVRRVQGNPWETLDTLTAKYRAAPIPGLPPLAAGGAVGYLAYDLYPFCQPAPMLTSPEPFLSPPDCYLGFYDVVLAWDHLDGSARLFSSGFTAAGDGGEERARRRLDEFLRALERGGPPCGGWEDEAGVVTPFARRGLVSNFTRPAYLEAVKKVKEYIAAGEVYQVNLSQRFTAPLTGSSFDLYRRLRSISPAPFSAFLRFPELAVGSSSPERFLRIEEDRIETRPIKGTRPRGRTAAEDREFRSELLASAKDQAEHIMIVDLERNDLGTVSRYGTVHVPEITACEEYSTVFHLTSTVEGRLKMGITPVQALAACFPGGSITGAPKIRALSIIDELEPTRRGIYTGALGYLGFDGSADLSVVIRTFVAHRGRVHFQVGGGIVADSDPEAEFQETLDKAAGFLRAIQGERGDEGCGPPGWTGP